MSCRGILPKLIPFRANFLEARNFLIYKTDTQASPIFFLELDFRFHLVDPAKVPYLLFALKIIFVPPWPSLTTIFCLTDTLTETVQAQ